MQKKSLPLSKVYQLLEPGPVIMITSSFQGKENIMTLSWQTMIDFEPPILACIISDLNYSFDLIKKSKECVLNIPAKELLAKTVLVGNVSGRNVNKFQKFGLSREIAEKVGAPLLTDCYANLECKVIDSKMAKKYNLFVLKVVKAWIRPSKKRPRQFHHCGQGVFVIDGERVKVPSRKK